jgi:hypothetical protein
MSSFEESRDTAEAGIKKLSQVAARIGGKASPDELKSMNSEASRLQRDAEAAIRRLETEAKGAPPSVRRGQLDTISTLKGSLNKARADLQKANDSAARGELLGKGDRQKKLEADATDKLAGAADKATSCVPTRAARNPQLGLAVPQPTTPPHHPCRPAPPSHPLLNLASSTPHHHPTTPLPYLPTPAPSPSSPSFVPA